LWRRLGLRFVGGVGFVEVRLSGSCCSSLWSSERYRGGGEGSVVGRRRLFLSLASISGGGFSFFGSRVCAFWVWSFSLGSMVWWAKLALPFGDPAACSKWWARVGKRCSLGVVNRVG
ncbi:unnamed protein product, partial [Brassica rapa]